MKLLVLSIENFQDIEMIGFLGTLNASEKLEKVVYWNPDKLNQISGSNKIGFIKTTNEINLDDFDSIFIPGGKSCIHLRECKESIDVIKHFIDNNKNIFAICDAPNALIHAGLLLDKKYTSYPIANIEKLSTKLRDGKKDVVVDGKYISGKAPTSSMNLAYVVIKELYGNELADKVWNKVSGNQ